MDGFYGNRGILTLASANNPEKLDPAILDRPSRFDRKFAFALPGSTERRRFLALCSSDLEADLRISEDGLDKLSAATDGYSFAYLKELFLSGMMAWIHRREDSSLENLMTQLAPSLREQMASALVDAAAHVEDSEDVDGFDQSIFARQTLSPDNPFS